MSLFKAGARVAVVGRSEDTNRETVRLIEEAGGHAVAKTVETFGRLDFAFNNAGVEQPGMLFGDIGNDEWNRQIGINLGGVFFCMKHEIEQMLKQGGGVNVNTGSGAAAKGFPKQAAYCAAKFGLVGLSKGAALDYAESRLP